MAELLISAVPSGVTGWRSLALVDELTGAALDVLVIGRRAHRRGPRCAGPGRRAHRLAADAGPGRRRSQLPRIRPDALEAPDFVGIGAKPTREDGQRGRRNGGGSPGVGCQLARPRPRWTIRFWLLKSRARPPPTLSRPERHSILNLSYIISAYCGGLYLTVTDHRRPLQIGVGMYDGFVGIVMVSTGSSYGPSPPIPTHPLLSSGLGAGWGCG